jgi:hypothetical protein
LVAGFLPLVKKGPEIFKRDGRLIFEAEDTLLRLSEIDSCHSCENRNPGSWLIFWIPASAGMTILIISVLESLNLGTI